MKIPLAALGITLFLAARLGADIVYLDDGTKLEGQIRKSGDSLILTTASGIEVTLKQDRIKSIEPSKTAPPDPAGAVDERLASLRRVADHMTDIHQIIDRYEKFVAQNPNVDAAKKDLLVWHDRLDQGLVKLGSKWMTVKERDQIQAAAQDEAIKARDFLKQNRLKEAEPLLVKAIADDPQNATALYLRGVMYYKQDQIDSAKKAFEAVNEIAAGYAPNLNNLAVIAWRTKSYLAALNYYDQAMIASPNTKQILDNVAEALHALPDESKNAPAAKKCALDFQEQDTQLQKTAAQDGFYRWGSTWVNAKQLDDLKAAEAKIKEKLDAINKDGNDSKAKMGQIDSEIDANQRQMDRMVASSIVMDAHGNQYQLPLPQIYYTLQNDNLKLAGDKKAIQSHLDDLVSKYKEVENSAPVPRYSGNQSIVGIEAAPTRVPAPTTMPSSPAPTTQP